MPLVNVELRGDLKLGIRLEKFPERARARLLAALEEKGHELLAKVQSKAPGISIKEAAYLKVFDDPKKVTARVAIGGGQKMIRRAGAFEYGGAHREFEVKAYNMRLDHFFASAMTAPLVVFVEAHDRTTGLRERRFIRDSAAQEKDSAIEALRDAIGEAIKDDE